MTTLGQSRYSTGTSVRLPDDIFSDGYLDEFYRTHIASRRTSLDEDIAAIEAEINKVHEYRHKFRSYRVHGPSSSSNGDTHLNSCGNSECSDDEENHSTDTSIDMEMLPTSVFKIYNSTSTSSTSLTNNVVGNNNVFSWAQYQLVSHDHTYSSPSISTQDSVYLLQDSLTLNHIHWNKLSVTKRVQALKRLAAILRNKPTSTVLLSPSLSYLPQSLADVLRSNNGIISANKASRSVDKDVIIKLSRDSLAQSLITAAVSLKNKKKTRTTPYDRTSRPVEITRVRYSCSESESPLEVD